MTEVNGPPALVFRNCKHLPTQADAYWELNDDDVTAKGVIQQFPPFDIFNVSFKKQL